MLTLQSIHFTYDGKHPVLNDVSLTIDRGEILCLLGASGSGKTTLLRVIAGLEADFDGDLLLNGQTIRESPSHQRGFGLVFQDFALFPHMTVAGNVAFGLRMQGKSRTERQQTVTELLALVGLEGYQDRDISSLSGGQQQRVALARSLAPQPDLLLLDEPLGSLDASLKERLLTDLRNIIKDRDLTAVYVTHDQQEALTVADRIAIMDAGRITQVDPPQRLYEHPASKFVAQFMGLDNFVSPDWLRRHNLPVTSRANTYLIHPDGLRIMDEIHEPMLDATLVDAIFLGGYYHLRVRVDDVVLSLDVSSREFDLQHDQTLRVVVDESAIIPLPSDR